MPSRSSVVGTLLVVALAAACGNLVDEDDLGPPAGLTGISVTEDGDYVIDAYVCRDGVDAVQIVRDREGLDESEENPVVRTYTSSDSLSGRVAVDLAAPSSDWTPGTPTTLEAGKGYIVSAQGSDNETSQLNIGARSLQGLVPGSVYTSDDSTSAKLTRHTAAEFQNAATKACE